MRKLMFALLPLAFALFGTQCWAQENCTPGEGEVVSCKFTPGPNGNKEGIYDFGSRGRLVVDFVRILAPGFTLTVTLQHPTDETLQLDPDVFPNTKCFHYPTSSECTQYNFTGDVIGHVNGLPQKGQDYQGLITLTLTYNSSDPPMDPAFGHAPRESTIFSEDILVAYLRPIFVDDTMDGTTPGLSSVIALNKSLEENDSFCFVSPHEGDSFFVGQEIEVAFRLTGHGTNCLTEDPIRDKDARLSLAMTDSNGRFISFPRLRKKEEGNKFHFDHEDGVNELDLSTEGLAPGRYTITVFSDEFSPHSVQITLIPGTDPDHPE